MLIGKIEQKKKKKEQVIEQAAFELFDEKGIAGVSIDMIARRAGIAKGTFYLYFKDKDAVLAHVVFRRGAQVLAQAMQQAMQQNIEDPIERIIYVTDYAIDLLKNDPAVLRVIRKNLSWSLMQSGLQSADDTGADSEVTQLLRQYLSQLESWGYTAEEAFQLVFMVVELIGSTCYCSIVLGQLPDIDTVKPMLFTAIRKMLRPS